MQARLGEADLCRGKPRYACSNVSKCYCSITHITSIVWSSEKKNDTPRSDLTAFFSKTPLPPRHRRPGRFKRSKNFRSRPRPTTPWNDLPSCPSWMRSQALQHSRHWPEKVCLGYKLERKFFRDRAKRVCYKHRFQYFCDIAEAAVYFLAQDNKEVDQSGREVLTYFADAEEELFHFNVAHDEADEVLEAWITDMFAVLDKTDLSSPTIPSSSTMDQTSYRFTSFSILKLKNVFDTLTLFSDASAGQHLLLDTGAPRFICY